MKVKHLLKTIALSTLFFLLINIGELKAQTTLSAGDIAIIGYNADGSPDNFAFVLLKSVEAGTQINFTDNGWLAAGSFRTGEGTDTWIAAIDRPMGSVITMNVITMNLSSSGDQILAYQGLSSSPTFLYAINNDGTTGWTDATSSNTSALPTDLIDGVSAIALSEVDNAEYNKTNTSDTQANLLAAISNTANWNTDDGAAFVFSFSTFSINDLAAPSLVWSPLNGATNIAVDEDITISFNEAIRLTDNNEINDDNVDALITLRETDENGTIVPFDATIGVNKSIITINPSSDLAGNQLYYVAIASVEDIFDYATSASNISFTTIDATTAVISDVAITETAPYYAGDNITVTWSSANVDFVKIEAWMPSESDWVELSASSDATDGTEIVTIPTDAMYSTNYKIRVSYVTTPSVNAESGIATVIATPSINTIQSTTSDGDLSVYNGDIVRINGIVTAEKASGSGYFVQDGAGANNGIYIYASVSAVNVGDEVTIQGTVFEYNNLTEISPATSVTVNNSGIALPAATAITTAQMLEEYESVLVKIVDAEATSVPDENGVFTIDDGSGATNVDDDLYVHTSVEDERLTITGIGYYSYSLYKVLPRDASDIQSAAVNVSSSVYTVNDVDETITNVPYTVSIDDFKANLTPATNASFNVFDANGTTPATVIDDTKLVIALAEDEITSKTYTITRNAIGTGTDILTFNLTTPATVGDVNATNHTVTLDVPYGTSVTALVPTITVSDGASVSPLSGVAQDFTSPVTYTVTAEDLSTQPWTVTVNVAAPKTDKDILTFDLVSPSTVGTVNATNHTVTLNVPSGTAVTALVPTITVSDGASISPLSGVAQDFTSPVTYTVTAEDLSTQPWTVTVSIATGINNISNINFKVYPNPFNDEILLDGISQNCKVSIQSINGQVLIEKIITNQDNRINTQSLKSGVYIITIINDNGKRITKKMLKE